MYSYWFESLETTLTVFEVTPDVSRLHFDSSSNMTMKSFVFNTTNELTCMDVMVFADVSHLHYVILRHTLV